MWRLHGFFLKGFAVTQRIGDGGAIAGGNGVHLRVFWQVHGYESQGRHIFREKHADSVHLSEILFAEIYSC